MLFALGTTNIPKTNAIREALATCPYMTGHTVMIEGFKVASGVPDMPLTLHDLRLGAKNRVEEVRRLCPQADFCVGMEGGVYRDMIGDEYWLIGVVYMEDAAQVGHYGYSCHMRVPDQVMA